MSSLKRPTVEDIVRSGFSTPWDAPTIPPFPFRFRNAEILTLFYRTSPEAMALLSPPPVEPEGDVAAIHIYRMNDTEWLGIVSRSVVEYVQTRKAAKLVW